MATIKQTFTLTVNPAPLAFVTPPTLPAVSQGQPANIPIVVEGGTPPDAFSVSNGLLPAGMLLFTRRWRSFRNAYGIGYFDFRDHRNGQR